MHLIKATTLSLSIAACLAITPVTALDFSDTWFFGDSLTDSGAFKGNPDAVLDGKFTTSPGMVWSEHLAEFFNTDASANNPNNPDNTNPNGSNFAQGGAQVTSPVGIGQGPSPRSASPVNQQIDFYLKQQGQADKNALYSIWAGSNDVFFNMLMVGGGLPMDAAMMNISGSASDLVGAVQRLTDAGARYVLVPNLVDIGGTPAMLLDVVDKAGKGNPHATEALIAAATILAKGGTDTQQVQMNALAAAEAALGLANGALTPAYQQSSGLASILSQQFNSVLLAQGNASNANIIALNSWALFDEVITNPGSFGLVNVTGTACRVASALSCTSATLVDPRAADVFMFADGVHPTSAMHQIISDYALSVISAPALIANLAEFPLGLMRNHQQALEQQIRMGFADGWSIFANGGLGGQDMQAGQAWNAGSNDFVFTLGVAHRFNQDWAMGAAFETSYSDVDFAKNRGSFEISNIQLSAFASYTSEIIFANAIASLGLSTDLDNIEREIKLGKGVRSEKGNTSADSYAIKASLGANLLHQDNLNAGPFASLNYQSVTVDSYRERGNSATAMNFGSQDRDSLLLEAGAFVDYTFANALLHGALSYEAELQDDSRSIRAGLNSLQGSHFKLYDIEPSDHYWKLNLGASTQLSSTVSVGIDYALTKGDGDNDSQFINLGVNVDL